MRYWIDADDRLAQVDEEWRAFAVANGFPELASASILRRPIASFCSDRATNEIWSRFLQRARAGSAIEARIRCDAPSWRRLFDLRLTSPNGGFVVVTTHVVSEEPRAAVALLDAHRQAEASVLVCCSWCKKWRAPDARWMEVEDLVSALGLMERELLPDVSHAICPECRGRLGAGGAQG